MEVIQSTEPESIPAIEDPAFGTDYGGEPDEEVIVVDLPGERPRAYPTRILHYHEMANDLVADRALLVTWCVICGSAIVYDREVDGRRLTFAQSGKLADDAMVMFDRETGSEWQQTSGECIEGPLEGRRLSLVGSRLTTWRQFAADHPDGLVLQPPGGASESSGASTEPEPIDYEDDFAGYREGEGFGRYALYEYLGRKPTIHYDPERGEWTDIEDHPHYTSPRDWPHDIPPKAAVLGVGFDGDPVGFARPDVERADGVARTTVGSTPVVVFATPDGLFAYEDPGYDFDRSGDGRYDADGTSWDGASGAAADGRSLTRLPTRRLYAFAWDDAYGFGSLYRPRASDTGAPPR